MIPTCPTHGTPMVLQTPGTPEQKWCGDRYNCGEPRCHTSTLIPSPELEASLAEQRKRSAQPTQPALGL